MNPILNREYQLPQDGYIQLVPKGRYPHSSGLLQVVDDQACAAMLNRFQAESAAPDFPGLLLDYDHFSQDTDKSSEAAGWILALQNRDDGLYGLIRWAGSGEDKVRSGAYRFISPVWNRADCETLAPGQIRPLRLLNAALTNEPNMKGLKPLTNRAGGSGEHHAGQSGGKESTMDYKAELLSMLGLPADAGDEQITSGCADHRSRLENACKDRDTMKNRAETAEARLAELDRKALEAQIEADLETHKAVIANRDDVKAALLANREGTLKLIASLNLAKPQEAPADKPGEPRPPALRNREGQPPPTQPESQTLDARREAFVEEVRIKNRCSKAKAWTLAASLQPDLFK